MGQWDPGNASEIQHPQVEVSHPPGNQHILPGEKENHLQKCLSMGYFSSQEGKWFIVYPTSHLSVQNQREIWDVGAA